MRGSTVLDMTENENTYCLSYAYTECEYILPLICIHRMSTVLEMTAIECVLLLYYRMCSLTIVCV